MKDILVILQNNNRIRKFVLFADACTQSTLFTESYYSLTIDCGRKISLYHNGPQVIPLMLFILLHCNLKKILGIELSN